jgi:hypothetical protein
LFRALTENTTPRSVRTARRFLCSSHHLVCRHHGQAQVDSLLAALGLGDEAAPVSPGVGLNQLRCPVGLMTGETFLRRPLLALLGSFDCSKCSIQAHRDVRNVRPELRQVQFRIIASASHRGRKASH